MVVVGLVGGIASGKSTVAQEMALLGAAVLDADLIAHEVLNRPEIQARLIERWGDQIVRPDGTTDRRALGSAVFGARANDDRRLLEQLVHPPVREQLQRQMELHRRQGRDVVVLDVPLLLEAGWKSICDVICFVDAPEPVRRDRALQRGWTPDQFRQREAAQWPVEKKRQAADVVVDNSSPLDGLRHQISSLMQKWTNAGTRDEP